MVCCSILKIRDISHTRLQNPTNDAWHPKIAALKVVWAPCDLVRQAANFYAIFTSVGPATILYMFVPHHLRILFQSVWRHAEKLGIECTFVNANASEEQI